MNDLRISIKDIIDSTVSTDILYSINNILKHTSIKFIKLWHNGDITQEQLTKFSYQVDKIINKTIPVKITQRLPDQEFAWFDILNKNDIKKYQAQYRFLYSYSNPANIIIGINQFHMMDKKIENTKGMKIKYNKGK